MLTNIGKQSAPISSSNTYLYFSSVTPSERFINIYYHMAALVNIQLQNVVLTVSELLGRRDGEVMYQTQYGHQTLGCLPDLIIVVF